MMGIRLGKMQFKIQIAQEEEAGIQSTQEEFEFMAAVDAYEETESKSELHFRGYIASSIHIGTSILSYLPIPEPHQVQLNDSNVTSMGSSVEQGGETVEQYPINIEEIHVLYDSLYNDLSIEVKKVNSVNRKLRETNADLTNELARYKNQ
nr:hypothetical protein [Tanacetum cinerariifolium]